MTAYSLSPYRTLVKFTNIGTSSIYLSFQRTLMIFNVFNGLPTFRIAIELVQNVVFELLCA